MPLKAGSRQNPLGQISVKWNEVKVKWKGEMKWNEKEEGGWGLHGPRGYCYPHYEPLEQRPTMMAGQSRTNIVCVRERERRGWERWWKWEKKIKEGKKGKGKDRKYWQNPHKFHSGLFTELLFLWCVWSSVYVCVREYVCRKCEKTEIQNENTIAFFSLK